MYVPTNVEVLASNVLLDHGITQLWNLNIYDLANAFDVQVKYLPMTSAIMFTKTKTTIIINSKTSKRNQYVQFLHELSHHIQEHIAFQYLEDWQLKYYELKANSLIQYLAIPYFLINEVFELKTVDRVANHFYVTKEIARKRLEWIENRLINRGEIYASIQRQDTRDMVFPNQLY